MMNWMTRLLDSGESMGAGSDSGDPAAGAALDADGDVVIADGGDPTDPTGESGGVVGGFEGDEAWKNGLPADLRGAGVLKDIRTVGDLAKTAVSLRKSLGNNVAIPGKDATEEELAAFHRKLGVPEKPDGYAIPTDNMPEGVTIEPQQLARYGEHLHRLGITEQQAGGLMRAHAQIVAQDQEQAIEAHNQQIEQWERELRTELGSAFKQHVEHAQNAIATLAGDDAQQVKELLKQTGLGSHPAIVKLFARYGREIAEDEVRGGGGGQEFSRTPREALNRLDEFEQKNVEAMYNPQHPEHKRVKAEHEKLCREAYGDEPHGQAALIVQ